jgi:CDP-diacylglycerol--glycerol-3-phosphate 3-phosphatidyltransferase
MIFSADQPDHEQVAPRALWWLPGVLVGLRFLLGPLLFLDAWDGVASGWFLVGLSAAFLSDVFDGVIARRIGVVTARLREADGRTDVWLYGWIAASAWISHPNLLLAYRVPLLVVIGTQTLAWIVDWAKYRRFSNYHAYTAKAWGVALFIATIALFGFNTAGAFLWLAIVCGMICTLEEIAMTLVLPDWTYDVASVVHAFRLRSAAATAPHAGTTQARDAARDR